MALIAIDGRKYFDYGIGTYVQQIVKAMSGIETTHEFILFVSPQDKKRIELPKGWRAEAVPYGKYSASEIAFLGFEANKRGVGVFHEPHYTLPIGLKGRSLVTIHDITHLRFPEYFTLPKRAYSRIMIWHALNDSGLIVTDSEYTKLDILRSFRVPENKIVVIPLGVGRRYKPLKGKEPIRAFMRKFGIGKPYILYVGNILPHKGIPLLLRAFKEVVRSIDVHLVIVGGSVRSNQALKGQAIGLGILDQISDLGRISNEELVLAYNAAEVLIMPSLYEGFGLPALEAMACGTPVIVSDAGSLPEIAGDAARMFKSGDVNDLPDSIRTVLGEPGTRKKMIQKGKSHVEKFTWDKAAKATLALYDQIAGG